MIPYRPAYPAESDKNVYENFTKPDLGDVLANTWDETLEFNPTTALSRLIQQDDPDAKTLSPEEANEKYAIGSLKFDEPVNESTAKRQYEANFAAAKRSEINRLGPQGLLPTAAKFGVAIAGSVIDPLNIASAVVPELAVGRVLAATGRAVPAFIAAGRGGTIAQRAAWGVGEGAVGAAIVEPLPYFAAQKDRLEYGLADSMLNIAVGGVLGGGLHSIGRAMELRRERAIAEKDVKVQAYIEEFHKSEAARSELSATVDGLAQEARHGIFKTAFMDVMEGRLPKNAVNMLKREVLSSQPRGLTEFTMKIDGTLSGQNQKALSERGGMMPAAAIPVERFGSRSLADKYIREQGDRTSYLTQRDGDDVVVLKIKDASMVRDQLGIVQRFKSFEEAKAKARELGDAQPVGFVKEKGKSQQEFVVVKGIDEIEAKRLQQDASFAEFYDPNQGVGKTDIDTANYMRDNGIELEDLNFERNMDEDLMTTPDDVVPDRIDPEEMADIATVEKAMIETDRVMKDLEEFDKTLLDDPAMKAADEEIADAGDELVSSKMLANCIVKNG